TIHWTLVELDRRPADGSVTSQYPLAPDENVRMAQTLAYVIPAFNEGRVIADVVRDLRAKGPAGHIIVIDDASRDDTSDAARSAGAIVLRHIINRGQGAALQTGFDAALKLGVDLVATFDADGQHDPRDVGKFIERLNNTG